jgi:hypothetical protein
MGNNALRAAVGAMIAASALAPLALAATPVDACLLLAPAQLSSAFGVAIAAGSHTTPQYLKTCTWPPSGAATPALKFVTLDIKASDGFEAGKQMLQQSNGKVAITPLAGVGDDAFYANFNGHILSLNVKKGAVAFKLSVYGDMAAQSMAAEKSLASLVVAQL